MWRVSSYSPSGNNCVAIGRGIGIRDTKSPAVHLPVGSAAWTAFLNAVKARPER